MCSRTKSAPAAFLLLALSGVFGPTNESPAAQDYIVVGNIIWQNNTRDSFDVTLSDYSKDCLPTPGDPKFTVKSGQEYVLHLDILNSCQTMTGFYLKWDYVQKRTYGSSLFSNAYLKASIAYEETVSGGAKKTAPKGELFAKMKKEIWIVTSQTPKEGKREWFRAQCTESFQNCLNQGVTGDGHIGKIIVPTVSGENQAILGITNRFGR
ncbi:hypothetical protein [Phyllobacterium phragmitis]|uniref:Uncharacterized protein n=1 Tax=Phyllobacterium phragmitis TaxID=2670329 RepID=A0ABQ0H581_9HYPH